MSPLSSSDAGVHPAAGIGVTDGLQAAQPQPHAHRRSPSSGAGLFSKFSFSRSQASDHQKQQHNNQSQYSLSPRETDGEEIRTPQAATIPSLDSATPRQPTSIATALQQQKTRRRRGSLRKVALLGRGAQRERREAHRANLIIDVKQAESYVPETNMSNGNRADDNTSGGLGLGISDITPRPSMEGYARRINNSTAPAMAAASLLATSTGGKLKQPKVEIDEPTPTSPTISYTTTDEEDALHMKRSPSSRVAPEMASLSSGSDGFYGHVDALPRRRTTTLSRARSPLIAATSLLAAEDDWDYSETEWWGWVILIVTWVVFVVGIGSVFGVWSWAWDVGTTPYAPPELEDDPTLPIVGYYPCLMILTCVMAWVWVVSAWVGMKYFRHAKISGD